MPATLAQPELLPKETRHARFSPDRLYRYSLEIRWAPGPSFMVIGLNPSTADEYRDDPTVRRCKWFAKSRGCGALWMCNLFAFRATDPKVMKAHPSPEGPENDRWLLASYMLSDHVLAAWGVHGSHRGRAEHIQRLLGPMITLGLNRDGSPKHPLYVPGATTFTQFNVSQPTT